MSNGQEQKSPELFEYIFTNTEQSDPERILTILDDRRVEVDGAITKLHPRGIDLFSIFIEERDFLSKTEILDRGFSADAISDGARESHFNKARYALGRIAFQDGLSIMQSVGGSKFCKHRINPIVTIQYLPEQAETTQEHIVEEIIEEEAPTPEVIIVSTFQEESATVQKPKNRTPKRPSPKAEKVFDDDLVAIYLNEIGRIPILTKEDEKRLAQAIEAGNAAKAKLESSKPEELTLSQKMILDQTILLGKEAAADFTQANLRLVVSIAKKYSGQGNSLLERIQNGNLGLIRAVEKFEWRKGFKFSTYATWWIKQSITRMHVETGSTIRLPSHSNSLADRIKIKRSKMEIELGRSPTVEELSSVMDIPINRVKDVIPYLYTPRSLNEKINEEGDVELGDAVEDRNGVSPEEAAIETDRSRQLNEMLSLLDERERKVICMRFGLETGVEMTLQQIGNHFGITRERARQIEVKAIKKLRQPRIVNAGRDSI